jgi:hypothetical protein
MANLKQVLFSALALSLFIAPLAAKASDDVGTTRNCMQTIVGKKIQAIAVYKGQGSYQSRLIVDGTELTALGCQSSTRPSTVFSRCSYQVGDYRIEFYPIAMTTSGKQKFMQYVIWHGDEPQYGSFTNCAN